jgi:hypothetical protein
LAHCRPGYPLSSCTSAELDSVFPGPCNVSVAYSAHKSLLDTGAMECRDKTGLESRMKVSYEEGLANYFGLRRRCDCGNNVVLSVRAGGSVGQLLSSEISASRRRPCHGKGKAKPVTPLSARRGLGLAESMNPCMRGKFQTREPGSPICLWGHVVMTHRQSDQRTARVMLV